MYLCNNILTKGYERIYRRVFRHFYFDFVWLRICSCRYTSIFQIAIVWGLAVALAIYVTRHLCPAHLNPAVSVSMVLGKRMLARKLPGYLLAQFVGALLAGAMIFWLFNPSIETYELAHGIERGTAASVDTARMFGEFYPNPGDALVSTVSLPLAIAAEAVGTFVLVLFIFCFTEDCNVGRRSAFHWTYRFYLYHTDCSAYTGRI